MGLTFSILFQHLGGAGGQRLTCPFGDKGPLVIGGKSVCKARVTIGHSALVIIGRNIYIGVITGICVAFKL